MQKEFMEEAIRLSQLSVEMGGGPFGAVVVKDGKIVGRGHNRVTLDTDPTAHAEVVAIRDACKNIENFQLEGCEIYTSCEPCPMCLGAIYWSRPSKVYYGNSKHDAAEIGFDDHFIYEELKIPLESRKIPLVQFMPAEANSVFQAWSLKPDRIEY